MKLIVFLNANLRLNENLIAFFHILFKKRIVYREKPSILIVKTINFHEFKICFYILHYTYRGFLGAIKRTCGRKDTNGGMVGETLIYIEINSPLA